MSETPTPAEVADLIEGGIEALEKQGWCRSAYRVPKEDGEGYRFCAMGSLREADGTWQALDSWASDQWPKDVPYPDPSRVYLEAVSAVARAIGTDQQRVAGVIEDLRLNFAALSNSNIVSSFNDTVAATVDDVIDVMREAAKELRNQT